MFRWDFNQARAQPSDYLDELQVRMDVEAQVAAERKKKADDLARMRMQNAAALKRLGLKPI